MFLRLRLNFVAPQYGAYYTSPFWRLEFWVGTCIFRKFVYPCSSVHSRKFGDGTPIMPLQMPSMFCPFLESSNNWTALGLCSWVRRKIDSMSVAYPEILFGGGGSTNSVEGRGQRERGSGYGSPLVRGSGGSCNLVQEISFHIVKFSYFFATLRLFMMTTNWFAIANVKQLRT
jgi:hypothetical protein